MKHRKLKKALSCIIAFVMAFALVTVPTSACEPNDPEKFNSAEISLVSRQLETRISREDATATVLVYSFYVQFVELFGVSPSSEVLEKLELQILAIPEHELLGNRSCSNLTRDFIRDSESRNCVNDSELNEYNSDEYASRMFSSSDMCRWCGACNCFCCVMHLGHCGCLPCGGGMICAEVGNYSEFQFLFYDVHHRGIFNMCFISYFRVALMSCNHCDSILLSVRYATTFGVSSPCFYC